MQAYFDLDLARSTFLTLNWPHDTKTRSVCVFARLGAIQDGNGSKHDIYLKNRIECKTYFQEERIKLGKVQWRVENK